MVEEQEIDLRDYINVVLKRKKLIITGTLICVAAAFIITLLMPKTYKTEAIFQNAAIPDKDVIVIENVVITGGNIINNAEVPEIILGDKVLTKALSKFSEIAPQDFKENIEIENIEGTDLFKITVKFDNPEAAEDICREIINWYFKYGMPLLEEKIGLLKSQISATDGMILNTEDLIKQLQRQIDSTTFEKGDMALEPTFKIPFLRNLYAEQQETLYHLYSKKDNLESQLLNIKKFKIVSSPFKPKNPVKPKIKLNILLSGILGLMFFTFLAFFVEYLKNTSRD